MASSPFINQYYMGQFVSLLALTQFSSAGECLENSVHGLIKCGRKVRFHTHLRAVKYRYRNELSLSTTILTNPPS